MRRKRNFIIFTTCLLVLLACNAIFAQKNAADKIAVARFEKNIEQGKFQETERPLLDYAIAHPQDAKALELLGRMRYLQNRLPEAKSLYTRAVALDANSVSAKIALGQIFAESGQKDEARRILFEAAQNPINNSSLQLNLARAFLFTGEPAKAIETAEKLPPAIKAADALPIIAAAYLESGKGEKLTDLLPLMKKAAISNPRLAAQCAEVLQNAAMNKEAVNLLRQTLAAAPNNFSILILLGKSEIAAKDFMQASQHLSQAAKLQPRSAQVFFAQALLAEAQGNSPAALQLLTRARQIEPNSAEILSQFVISAMRVKQTRAAIDAAKILLESKPDEPEYSYLLGAAFLQNGNIDAAQQNLQRFVELRPADSRGCLALGLTLASQPDKIGEARAQLNHCLEIDVRNVEARYQLGLSYKTQGETAKAVEYLEETVKQAPNYASALRDLGALYLQAGGETKARIVLEKAVALAPDDADTHFQLSRLYNLIGETALAKQHLEIFQKLKNSTVK
ncbi:MAG: tetratricopeptide repeat protein [Acidobacteriota bacterium]|nr:tetratricopeptide repeat protein [Acidobacteriota bacterium]